MVTVMGLDLANRKYAVLGMGEILLRLSPVGKDRISSSEIFEKNAGGAELNVVSGISMLGLPTAILSRIPNSEIGKYVRGKVHSHGVSDEYLISDDSPNARLGIYYYENGAYPRLPMVSYDRRHSDSIGPISLRNRDRYDKKIHKHRHGNFL